MNEIEQSILKDLRGPSAQVKGDSKQYMTDTKFRAQVDAADKKSGTTV